MREPLTVLIVDDDPGARRSLRWLLESHGVAVRTYPSAAAFLEEYDPKTPSCLLLDLQMPGMNGLELQEELARRGPCPPVIFITGHGDVPTCAQAMKQGAVDFIQKPVDGHKLMHLIRQAQEREQWRQRLEADEPELMARLARLTAREREVMERLFAGKSVKRIAAQLNISIQTVAKHRTRVLEKLDVRNDAELVRLLVRVERLFRKEEPPPHDPADSSPPTPSGPSGSENQ